VFVCAFSECMCRVSVCVHVCLCACMHACVVCVCVYDVSHQVFIRLVICFSGLSEKKKKEVAQLMKVFLVPNNNPLCAGEA